MNIDELKTSLNELYNEEMESKRSLNEGIIKDIFKEKKVEKRIKKYTLTSNDMKILKNQINDMIKELKSNYNKMRSTPQFKNKCIKSSKEYNEDFEDYPEDKIRIGYIPHVSIKIFEPLNANNKEAAIEIIEDEQDIRIQYDWILYDLVDSLKGNYNFDFDYGDGDEGCLYLTVSKNYIKKKVMEDDKNE